MNTFPIVCEEELLLAILRLMPEESTAIETEEDEE